MEVFPAVDPIPLPAPVWLFMALHTLTLILHFIALHFLIGGLLLAPAWGLAGRWTKDTRLRQVSQLIARRLPVVMTYVINLGVPPLLFTQVLYGRALYTSSILIGAWWISVIGLLLFGYSMLYVMVQRGETGRTFVLAGSAALLSVLMIAMIYSTNMTLMLRPERWPGIYRANPFGATFHTGDPTMFPRWLFMMLGSAGIGGVGLLLLSLKQDLTHDVQRFLRQWGGRLTVIFIALQVAAAVWVVQVQTAPVMDALAGVLFYRFCEGGWLVSAALLIILGALASARKAPAKGLVLAAAGAAFLHVTLLVFVRDGIRFATLSQAGFDVWDRTVNTNWSTVILFFLCFVLALGMLAWLLSVMARAARVEPTGDRLNGSRERFRYDR